MTAYETKQMLFRLYTEEMKPFMSEEEREITTAGWIEENCNFLINSEKVSWKNIFNAEGDIVGFVLIGKEYPFRHKKTDYSIVKAYVLPEWRGMGFFKERMERYLEKHPGKYNAVMYKGNAAAESLLNHIFESSGYIGYELNNPAEDVSQKTIGWKLSQQK